MADTLKMVFVQTLKRLITLKQHPKVFFMAKFAVPHERCIPVVKPKKVSTKAHLYGKDDRPSGDLGATDGIFCDAQGCI